MKYIFLAGAPGSKWSSVSNDLRNFSEVNTSDQNESYTKPGESQPMHTGAYWDPGMKYGKDFDRFSDLSTESLEIEFDRPFDYIDNHPRVIKSHQFANHLDDIVSRPEWIYNPVVLCFRPEDDAEKWWHQAGGWDISYPSYSWYKDKMSKEIKKQTQAIQKFQQKHELKRVNSVSELAQMLGMTNTTDRTFDDVDVYVYLHPRLHYFNNIWQHKTDQYSETGFQTLHRIGPDETVLDVGCGDNLFKSYFGNRLTGIDPINPRSDYRVSIDEFLIGQQYDHVLCYGSINFGSRIDIERQVKKISQCVKPRGRVHWRMNPGRYDHDNPEQKCLDLFSWNSTQAYEMANRNQFDIEEWKTDRNRIFSLWRKW